MGLLIFHGLLNSLATRHLARFTVGFVFINLGTSISMSSDMRDPHNLIDLLFSYHHRAFGNNWQGEHASCRICVRLGRNRQSNRRLEYWIGILVRSPECTMDCRSYMRIHHHCLAYVCAQMTVSLENNLVKVDYLMFNRIMMLLRISRKKFNEPPMLVSGCKMLFDAMECH